MVCQEKCPKKVVDDVFEVGLAKRKAIYTSFPQAVPKYPVIDVENCTYYLKGTCKACQIFCPTGAIDFDQQDEIVQINVATSSWPPATTCSIAAASRNTATGACPMLSPASNSSACPMPRGRPAARSS